jgi:sugar lactone lactonase YvrE
VTRNNKETHMNIAWTPEGRRVASSRAVRSWFAPIAALAALSPCAADAQLASGLQGASGSTVGPDGALYVTESWVGRVSRIDPGTGVKSTFAEGLPPTLPWIGRGGALDLAFLNVANPSPTDWFIPTGVQYALEPWRGGFLVSDGHQNRVLHVTLEGDVSEFRAFENIVPTGLEVQGNTVYLAQTGPAPHLPGDGKVVAFGPGTGAVAEVAAGAPLMVDVERGRGRTLFALAQGTWDGAFPGSPAIPQTGSLYEIRPDGSLRLVADGLDRPTSLEIIGNTGYVVTLGGDVWAVAGLAESPFGAAR